MRSAGTSIHSSSQGQGPPVKSGTMRPNPSASGCEVMIMVRKNSCASTVETFYLDNVNISYQSTSTQPVLVKAGYRYGFNGQEKDNEVSGEGNAYGFDARVYDPRIARWGAVDPRAAKYPNTSPYSAFGLNPIYFVDPGGDTLRVACNKQASFITDYNNLFGKGAFESTLYFDENDEVKFQTGYLAAKAAASVFAGASIELTKEDRINLNILRMITSEEVTKIIYLAESAPYGYNPETGKRYTRNGIPQNIDIKWQGGEGTVTVWDANIWGYDNVNQNTIFVVDRIVTSGTRESRFLVTFHGIGHVLFQRNSQQEKVIEFDNLVRSVANRPLREVDKEHENSPDPVNVEPDRLKHYKGDILNRLKNGTPQRND